MLGKPAAVAAINWHARVLRELDIWRPLKGERVDLYDNVDSPNHAGTVTMLTAEVC